MASHVEKTVEVNVPVDVAYNQWTQFEEFPKFMDGVEEVRQLSDSKLHWKVTIGGTTREWDAEILEQTPETRIEWKAIDGAENRGLVTFHALDSGSCRITARITYEPDSIVEQLGDAVGFVSGAVDGNLKRFKAFIEERGQETGSWRGEIHRVDS